MGALAVTSKADPLIFRSDAKRRGNGFMICTTRRLCQQLTVEYARKRIIPAATPFLRTAGCLITSLKFRGDSDENHFSPDMRELYRF
jgi:hypothetical protein